MEVYVLGFWCWADECLVLRGAIKRWGTSEVSSNWWYWYVSSGEVGFVYILNRGLQMLRLLTR